MKYECVGIYMNRGGTVQRSDVYAIDGEREYAFHEWVQFPHFGEVMAAAIGGTEAKTSVCYWMNGPMLPSKAAVMEHCAGLGSFMPEENPYPETDDEGNEIPSFFPVALDWDSAVALYERDRP